MTAYWHIYRRPQWVRGLDWYKSMPQNKSPGFTNALCSGLVPLATKKKKKNSFQFSDHQSASAPRPPMLVLMGNDESTGGCEKAPLPRRQRTPHLRFPISTVEWRFAVWLLGTVGQCSQSSVCSLACRAPRVSLAPEGKQTKRHHCLARWSWSPTHLSFLLNGGTFLFLGEEGQRETSSLETGPRDNKTAVVLSYVSFLSLNAILSRCLWWCVFFFFPPLFALCFLPPFVSL